jgi:peptidoglycan/LPS O-acetylase OafA/YrhL
MLHAPARRDLSSRSDASGAPARRLDLDVVRGCAILLALGWHFSQTPSGNPVLDALQWPGGTFGWAGVDLFFVLSGFLVGQLVFREQQRTGRFDGRRFTVRRALKLWPVLYVFLAVQLLAGVHPADSYLWQTALHVQNYAGTGLPHLWSLAVEEHFYLVLAVLFPLAARRRLSPRALMGVLAGVLVAALALRVCGELSGVSHVRLQWRTHFRADSLAAGVLLAAVAVHRPVSFGRLLRLRWLWLAVTALGVLWLAHVGKGEPLGTTLGFTVAYLTAAAFLLSLYDIPVVAVRRVVGAARAAGHRAGGRAGPVQLRHLHLAHLRRPVGARAAAGRRLRRAHAGRAGAQVRLGHRDRRRRHGARGEAGAPAARPVPARPDGVGRRPGRAAGGRAAGEGSRPVAHRDDTVPLGPGRVPVHPADADLTVPAGHTAVPHPRGPPPRSPRGGPAPGANGLGECSAWPSTSTSPFRSSPAGSRSIPVTGS